MTLPSSRRLLERHGLSLTFAAVVQKRGRVASSSCVMRAGTCDKLLCLSQVREVYERAIANVPPAPEKRYWQRYIYLWIRYALWEELEAEDAERTRQVYRACLNLIPHSIFTFAKVSPPRLGLQPPFIWAPRNLNLCSTLG